MIQTELKEVPYLTDKAKDKLINLLNDNEKYEYLMFNLWRTRGVLSATLEKNNSEVWQDQMNALNDLINVLIGEGVWSQDLFIHNPPKKRFK